VLPNGEVIAGLTGVLARVTRGFDPDDGTLELQAGAVDPGDFVTGSDLDNAEYPFNPTDNALFFLRVWNQGSGSLDATVTPATAIPAIGTFVELGATGLKVKFSANLHRGAFWIIAARPDSRKLVVPWSLQTEEPAHGPRKFYAP